MKTRAKYKIMALLALCLCCGGCGSSSDSSVPVTGNAAVVPYHPEVLWNFQKGRDYAAAGRYELAREHYQLARANAYDATTQKMIDQELQSIDAMIKATR